MIVRGGLFADRIMKRDGVKQSVRYCFTDRTVNIINKQARRDQQAMAGRNKKDIKAAQEACEILLNILPRSEDGIHNIAYTFGLICRESGIAVEQATDFIMSWSERLRTLPNFRELYPLYRKPSFYRYQVRYAVKSAYARMQDKPSSHWFRDLTGKQAPAASFWGDIESAPSGRRGRPRKPA